MFVKLCKIHVIYLFYFDIIYNIGCRLEIDAKREETAKEEKDDYVRRERQYGEYSRSFILPDNCSCDKSKVVANYKKGVLEIEMPKSDENKENMQHEKSHVNVA